MPEMITCAKCQTKWSGAAVAHCSGCHASFAGVSLFDKHRTVRGEHGTCLDPETVRNGRTGQRVMFLRDGVWRGPEMTEEQKLKRFGQKAR
jgi:hypothetical protein